MNAPHFWQLILGTVVALLPVINPVASAPVLLAITEGDTAARRAFVDTVREYDRFGHAIWARVHADTRATPVTR